MRLDRRSLLGLSAAALAATSLPAPARPRRRPRAVKKGVKIGMVQEGATLRDRFQLLVDLGYDGVELDSPNDLALEEVLAARDATGLAIPGVVDSVHWGEPLNADDPAVRERGRAGLEQAVRDAHAYGGTNVLLVPAVVNRSLSYQDAWTRSMEGVRAVLPLAEELGVTIAFENVWNNFLLSPLEAARYVDAFESPSVGFHFDVGNVVLYGWPEQWIRVLGPRLSRLDVKEYSREKAREEGLWAGFGVELLEGDCGWDRVVAALDEVGYEGWAMAEVAGGDRARLAEVKARMDRIFDAA